MGNYKEKIIDLIFSGEQCNIDLALELMRGSNINIGITQEIRDYIVDESCYTKEGNDENVLNYISKCTWLDIYSLRHALKAPHLFKNVVTVYLEGSVPKDIDISKLELLEGLKSIEYKVDFTRIRNMYPLEISSLKNIEKIKIGGNTGIYHDFTRMDSLKCVHLYNYPLSKTYDYGRMAQIEKLILLGVGFSDGHVNETFSKMVNLKSITIDIDISAKGIKKLSNLLPNDCKIWTL